MDNSIERIVTYEEIADIVRAGTRADSLFNPSSSDKGTYIQIIPMLMYSRAAMVRYCEEHSIPYTTPNCPPQVVIKPMSFVTVRDTAGEAAAADYMRSKYPTWDGNWDKEFVGFVMGWRASLQRS